MYTQLPTKVKRLEVKSLCLFDYSGQVILTTVQRPSRTLSSLLKPFFFSTLGSEGTCERVPSEIRKITHRTYLNLVP